MEKNGISVIVPMLNAEQYIEKCITSILCQGKVVKEVICVDNGSEDKSKELVLRMKEADGRIKLFVCEQKGVSVARNMGMKQANGKYIMFVDSDDYLKGKKLNRLYKKAETKDADILVFGGTSTEPLKTPHWARRVLSPRNHVCTMAVCENIFKERGVLPATWNKLYNSVLLKELKFSEQLRIAEDKLFQFCSFSCAKRVVFVNERIYVYRVNADSVMSLVDEKDKEEQHALAMKLAEEWVRERMPDSAGEDSLEKFKDTFKPEPVMKGRIQRSMFYIRNYGFRSFVEFIIGQLLHK